MKPLKLFEAFSGIGAQRAALNRLGIPYESVGISEIDRAALLAYAHIHQDIEKEVEYPSESTMREVLSQANVGFDFKQNKCGLPKSLDDLKLLYRAHCTTHNYGDISRINPYDLPDMDLFTYSFPCTDVSLAGKSLGLERGSGTRSSLLWECQKIIAVKKPPFLLMENVKALVGGKHRVSFDAFLAWLETQGYTNHWSVLNAKNYIPQNRERVFVVSFLNPQPFEMPTPQVTDGFKLKDLLDEQVDTKYYLSDNRVNDLLKTCRSYPKETSSGIIQLTDPSFSQQRVYSSEGIAPTLAAGNSGGGKEPCKILEFHSLIPSPILKDLLETDVPNRYYLKESQVKDLVWNQSKTSFHPYCDQNCQMSPPIGSNPFEAVRYCQQHCQKTPCFKVYHQQKSISLPCIVASRGRNPLCPTSRVAGLPTQQHLEINTKGVSNTLTTIQKDNYVLDTHLRIRKLTPRETYRLMGFTDEEFNRAAFVCSDSHLYKQAGNSIVVPVLVDIFKQLFLDATPQSL